MRVIAGKAKSLPLMTVEGKGTRPTTDRIKETLFNMLSDELVGACFLDLFAGRGAIGIEALSRGAKMAWFVERDTNCCQCIKKNIEFTKLTGGEIYQGEVISFLQTHVPKEPFDYVFMDPPYDQNLECQVLSQLKQNNYLAKDALIIVEASLRTSYEPMEMLGYELIRQKKYKTNQHLFFIPAE